MAAVPTCIGFIGPSGAGKSTVIARALPILRAEGLRVAVLKHSHHALERPGSDSARFTAAGADGVAVVGADGVWLPGAPPEADPRGLAARWFGSADLVLVEGFRAAELPAFRVERPGLAADPGWVARGPVLGWIAGPARPGAIPIDDPRAIAAAIRAAAAQLREIG